MTAPTENSQLASLISCLSRLEQQPDGIPGAQMTRSPRAIDACRQAIASGWVKVVPRKPRRGPTGPVYVLTAAGKAALRRKIKQRQRRWESR